MVFCIAILKQKAHHSLTRAWANDQAINRAVYIYSPAQV